MKLLDWAKTAAEKEIATDLVGQTARCGFDELQRFFAQGVLLEVAADLDLIQVATALALDDVVKVDDWRATNLVGPVADEQAQRWVNADATLWTLVVKPWILVQEASDS